MPAWSKKKEFKPLINARLETIDEKVSFKKLIKLFQNLNIVHVKYFFEKNILNPLEMIN